MRTIKIKKRSGGVRKIVVPSRKVKAELQQHLEALNYVQLVTCDLDIVHGFIPGRNPVTCAQMHIGFQYTLNCDLSDFFDGISRTMIENLNLNIELPYDMFYKGNLAQGLPTSPALANLAASKMDAKFKEYCSDKGIVYTRYADDLSFSGNNKEDLLCLRDSFLNAIINDHSFKLNPKKTRFLSAGKDGTWTREIVGVGVNHERVLPLRYSKRKLRALEHKTKYDKSEIMARKAKGMKEWTRLKTPNEEPSIEEAEGYFLLKELGAAV